jgi:iron complex outermembrane recepter protein
VGGSTSLHAGASRRGRFPALREAFAGSLNRFAPNPELGPEYLTALEAGVTAHRRAGQLQVVTFFHTLDDAIVRITLPDRRFMRVNENRVRTLGVEMLGALRAGAATLGGSLVLQSATLVTPTTRTGRLENQPELSGSLQLRSRLPLGVEAGLHADYTGRQFCLAATGEDVRLDGGTTLGGELRRQWRVRHGTTGPLSRVEARAAVDNAGDVALYDQCGLPRPGRLARLQFRLF